MTAIFVLLAIFGLAYIVGHSVISLPVREWLDNYGSPKRTHWSCFKDCANSGRWIDGEPDLPIRCLVCNATARCDRVVPARHPLRWTLALIECPACLSTWLGFIAGAFAPQLFWPPALDPLLAAFATGCLACASSFLLARVTNLIPNPNGPTEH